MSTEHLGVYLNDHLAGSVAALDILAALEDVDDHREWAEEIRAEVTADREELERLMQTAHVQASTVRRAAGWVTEKLAELKTRLDDRRDGSLHVMELLEMLSLGIEGKRSLWAALQATAPFEPALRTVDYPLLINRAIQQRSVVEEHRLQAAQKALRAA
jgi:hypothetical protein